MKVGNRVKLAGKTKHGKNRVREQGELWIVVKIKKNVVFASDMRKEFALLRAEARPAEFWRWVAIDDDKNFTMELIPNDIKELEGV